MDGIADRARTIESDYQRVAYHLAIWKIWMRNGKTLGHADHGAVVMGAALHFEDHCDRADLRSAETMDAVIDSLDPYQSAAVYHFNLGAVYRFMRMRAEDAYAEALEAMVPMIRRRGLE